jgi:hypothetical protein
MNETQFNLKQTSEEAKLDKNAVYLIDFSKLETVNDLVVILASMGISFSPHHPNWEVVKKFVNLDNPVKVNQPEKKEMNLPKLKTLK